MPLIIVTTLYLFTRLFHLAILPIFNDEAIYLYWAKIIATTHTQWFISLTDGKPPLLIWAMSFFLNIFPSSQYLLAGRIPSVLAGLITMLGIYSLSRFLFYSKTIAIVTALLYIITPFALLHDRMALFDSFLSSMLVWAVYFSLRTARSLQEKDALGWGFFLGMAALAKINALLFLFLTPLCFFLSLPKNWVTNHRKKALKLLILAIAVSQLLQHSLLVSRGYQEYVVKSTTQYIVPFSTLIRNPFIMFPQNIVSYLSWFVSYTTVGIVLLGIAGFALLMKTNRRSGTIMMLLWSIPLIATSFASIRAYPRYVLFVLPYVLIAAGYAAARLLRKRAFALLLIPLLLFPLLFDARLLAQPHHAPLPDIDSYQYVSGFPSGYGLQEIFTFLHSEAKSKPITVVPLGMLGSFPYAFYLEFWDNPRITVRPFWPVKHTTREEIRALSKTTSVYVVMKYNADGEHSSFLEELNLQKILEAKKPNNNNPVLLAFPKP